MTKEKAIKIQNIIALWKSLENAVFEEDLFDEDMFIEAFSGTYDILKDYAREQKIDREVMCLIKVADSFTKTHTYISERMNAAETILNEFLYIAVFSLTPFEEPLKSIEVFSDNNGEEITINFENPKQAIDLIVGEN